MKQSKTTAKKTKLYLKLVALTLSLVMLIFSSSLGVFAVDGGNIAQSAQSESVFSEAGDSATVTDSRSYFQTDSVISSERIGNVIEITDRREENVKHFSLPNGTIEAVVYSKPVHRKDASGDMKKRPLTVEMILYAKYIFQKL